MSGINNWSEVLADPCFWVGRYAQNHHWERDVDRDVETFFGRSFEDCDEFHLRLYGDDNAEAPLAADDDIETPLPPDAEGDYSDFEDYGPASTLELSFPENYTWRLLFADHQVAHLIYHPQEYPGGHTIAMEGANAVLPGLRWAELKQMVACCLSPEWAPAFDPHILYPLLYPIVDPVTLAEYDEVRQTLRTAWEALRIVPPSQLEAWLDVRISVFENGRVLRHDAEQGWYDPAERRAQEQAHAPTVNQNSRPAIEGGLWAPDPAGGWYTRWPTWGRTFRSNDARPFAPFFEMLDRQTQSHS